MGESHPMSTGADRPRGVRALPCVSTALDAVTTLGIDRVTALLASAGYFGLRIDVPLAARSGGWPVPHASGSPAVRMDLATHQRADSSLVGEARLGGPAAVLDWHWRGIPDDWVARPGDAPPSVVFDPGRAQRFEVDRFELRFAGTGDGFRAYGTGRTLLAAGPGLQAAAVLDIEAGWGAFAGLPGTVLISGRLEDDRWIGDLIVRVMDPAGGLIADRPLPLASQRAPGLTPLAFLGEVDPSRPVTLRFSLTEGLLGSNVFERLRAATMASASTPAGAPVSRTTAGPETVGAVSARLSFNPLAWCGTTPVQTRQGVFAFEDGHGRSLGTICADMTEGRSFRTRLDGRLLPVFRFGGFGPIAVGTGSFTGARGVMVMNSVISVQPRTLSNLYVLWLDDPVGRVHAGEEGRGGEA